MACVGAAAASPTSFFLLDLQGQQKREAAGGDGRQAYFFAGRSPPGPSGAGLDASDADSETSERRSKSISGVLRAASAGGMTHSMSSPAATTTGTSESDGARGSKEWRLAFQRSTNNYSHLSAFAASFSSVSA